MLTGLAPFEIEVVCRVGLLVSLLFVIPVLCCSIIPPTFDGILTNVRLAATEFGARNCVVSHLGYTKEKISPLCFVGLSVK